ncbi:MAG TPA: low molecular weight phosphatase family protein [Cellulomonadaceae bacterium]|nr:low molecular weight phosphatase family protein [Cellulomonadaceae bacterium]
MNAFSVLVVCTGNVCRSPAVERLLAARLPGDVHVGSAGTRALVGATIAAPMVPLIEGAGGSAEGFVARAITEELVDDADVIIAAAREHRSIVVGLHPPALVKAFTLRELARLATLVDPAALPSGSPAERFKALVPLARAARGRVLVPPEEDDVVDPYGHRRRVYRTSFDQLAPAVDEILRVVTSHRSGTPVGVRSPGPR